MQEAFGDRRGKRDSRFNERNMPAGWNATVGVFEANLNRTMNFTGGMDMQNQRPQMPMGCIDDANYRDPAGYTCVDWATSDCKVDPPGGYAYTEIDLLVI